MVGIVFSDICQVNCPKMYFIEDVMANFIPNKNVITIDTDNRAMDSFVFTIFRLLMSHYFFAVLLMLKFFNTEL